MSNDFGASEVPVVRAVAVLIKEAWGRGFFPSEAWIDAARAIVAETRRESQSEDARRRGIKFVPIVADDGAVHISIVKIQREM